jgi:hypothetical protein
MRQISFLFLSLLFLTSCGRAPNRVPMENFSEGIPAYLGLEETGPAIPKILNTQIFVSNSSRLMSWSIGDEAHYELERSLRKKIMESVISDTSLIVEDFEEYKFILKVPKRSLEFSAQAVRMDLREGDALTSQFVLESCEGNKTIKLNFDSKVIEHPIRKLETEVFDVLEMDCGWSREAMLSRLREKVKLIVSTPKGERTFFYRPGIPVRDILKVIFNDFNESSLSITRMNGLVGNWGFVSERDDLNTRGVAGKTIVLAYLSDEDRVHYAATLQGRIDDEVSERVVIGKFKGPAKLEIAFREEDHIPIISEVERSYLANFTGRICDPGGRNLKACEHYQQQVQCRVRERIVSGFQTLVLAQAIEPQKTRTFIEVNGKKHDLSEIKKTVTGDGHYQLIEVNIPQGDSVVSFARSLPSAQIGSEGVVAVLCAERNRDRFSLINAPVLQNRGREVKRTLSLRWNYRGL